MCICGTDLDINYLQEQLKKRQAYRERLIKKGVPDRSLKMQKLLLRKRF